MNLSFSGCGFMGVYHVGVASAIREYAPDLVVGKITGASAGAMAACGLICNICLGQATSDVLKIVTQARQRALGPLHPSFNLVRILRSGLLKNLPPDAYRMCSGRLHISLTRFSDGKNVLVSQFDSQDELVQALICSAFIPFYCGALPPTFKGVRYIDGGWSDNMPTLDENTITISPFSGESDICPQDSESASFLSFDLRGTNVRFTARNIYRIVTALFPPHPEIMSEMCRQGFEDALRYLARRGLLSCTRCISVRSSIYFTTRDQLEDDDCSSITEPTPTDTEAPKSVDEITTVTTPATPSFAIGGSKMNNKRPAMNKAKTMTRLRQVERTRNAENRSMSESHVGHMAATACENCRHAAQVACGKGLPKIVKDTLAIAEATERGFIAALFKFTPVKLIRYLTIPWLLPLDITYALCRRFLEWLPTLPDDVRWLVASITEAVNFVLNELEAHKTLSTRFSCQLAITELNYSNSHASRPASPPPAAPQQPSTVAALSRRTSVVTDPSQQPGQYTVAEANFGYTVDMSAKNQRLRQMANIVHKDRPETSKFAASRVAHVAENLGWEGLQMAGGSAESAHQEDFDTFASILDFTRRQDALMAYYYLDENNQMKVTEIYGLNTPEADRVASLGSRSCSRRQSFKDVNSTGGASGSKRSQTSKDDSGVSGVSAAELEAALLANVPESSSSHVNNSSARRHSQHQQTPPDRESAPGGTQRSSSAQKTRRMSSGNSSSGRAKTMIFASPMSTASESEETERLFVPDRRRRPVEPEAADYEPEDSSGED